MRAWENAASASANGKWPSTSCAKWILGLRLPQELDGLDQIGRRVVVHALDPEQPPDDELRRQRNVARGKNSPHQHVMPADPQQLETGLDSRRRAGQFQRHVDAATVAQPGHRVSQVAPVELDPHCLRGTEALGPAEPLFVEIGRRSLRCALDAAPWPRPSARACPRLAPARCDCGRSPATRSAAATVAVAQLAGQATCREAHRAPSESACRGPGDNTRPTRR